MFLFFSILLSLSPFSFAHEEKSDLFNLDQTVEVFRKALEVTPEILNPAGPVKPVIRLGGKTVLLDSNFWELVRGWVKVYQNEVARDCAQCLELDAEKALSEVKDLAAQGFFNRKVYEPLAHASEHIIFETADIGARLGNVAFVAKISSEVAETVLSKTVGGGGVHVLCSIIDAAILFGTRHLQIATRLPWWGVKLGAGSLGLSAKYWVVSKAVHRAQKRVSFETGPIELDEEALQQLDLEGPVNKRRRSQWLSLLERNLNPLYLEKEKILKSLEQRPQDELLKKSLSRVERKISRVSALKTKNFLGKRYKRFLFLKGRRGKQHLNGRTPIDKALSKPWLWILSVQQNILHRGMVPSHNEGFSKAFENHVSLKSSSSDPVLVGLAEEFSKKKNNEAGAEDLARALLADVEFIFDRSQPAKYRYLKTLIIENALAQMAYKFMSWKADSLEQGDGGWWKRTYQSARFNWLTSQFVKHVFQYTDFLRLAATTSSEKFEVKYRYEAMESLLRLLKHLEGLSEVLDSSTNVTEALSPIRELNSNLETFKPWREKRSSYSWLLVKRTYPRCEELWEEGH